MRFALFAAASLAASLATSLGSAALAQTNETPAPLTTTPEQSLSGPTVPTTPVVTAAQMDAINAHTESDDATMQALNAVELKRSGHWLSAIRPALPFRGPTYLPQTMLFGIKGPDAFHIEIPKRPD